MAALADVAPALARILNRNMIVTPPLYAAAQITCETVMVTMRDGVRLATDLYTSPRRPAPAVILRTPYGRDRDVLVGLFMSLARRGYVAIGQDCRGAGASEPDHWDYYMYEPQDGYDTVDWVKDQPWFDGFLGSCGASYNGQMQWQMALHPAMSTIVPEVSGLGAAINTVRTHMFSNVHARSVGKGESKVAVPYYDLEGQILTETLRTGYYNESLHKPLPRALIDMVPDVARLPPLQAQRRLWEHYSGLSCSARAAFVKRALNVDTITTTDVAELPAIFGQNISHDRHTLPHPALEKLCADFHAPVLLRTGWYDWGLNDTLATWALLTRHAPPSTRAHSRLLITPAAHNMTGYHEGMAQTPALGHAYGTANNVDLFLKWYETVRTAHFDSWPPVIFYLMGANEWRAADAWPVADATGLPFYLHDGGVLSPAPPVQQTACDRYIYDPDNPTPTVGGSIVSYVYTPGSVDVSDVQKRADVLTYTTPPLTEDLDVVGPLRMVLYASSSARDTDFVARLSDVFPDGRAIQLQNGMLRARHRDISLGPQPLEPGQVYRLEIDMWATANRFKAGHRLRVDISSADFPRFDRNTNRCGDPGAPVKAVQTIFRDATRPSHVVLSVLGGTDGF